MRAAELKLLAWARKRKHNHNIKMPRTFSDRSNLKDSMRTDALSTKDVAYLLDNRDDPEVDAAIKQYLKAQYAGGKATPSTAGGELASKVEKKYIAAQVVAQGVQVNMGALHGLWARGYRIWYTRGGRPVLSDRLQHNLHNFMIVLCGVA